MTATIIL